eukprot:Gb_33576 [translate_table: standard]
MFLHPHSLAIFTMLMRGSAKYRDGEKHGTTACDPWASSPSSQCLRQRRATCNAVHPLAFSALRLASRAIKTWQHWMFPLQAA